MRFDAAGKFFCCHRATDKADPDYAKKRKEFEEYPGTGGKEPLAVKLADTVGHVRVATNFNCDSRTGYLVLFMQAVSPFSPVVWCAGRTLAIS